MATASDLSSPRYAYDFVVATTQNSINATMKRWLFTMNEPSFVVCYVADEDGNSVPISYEDLKKKANTDPFALAPNINPKTDQGFKNLLQARFMGGFRVTPGTPGDWDPEDIPDILNFDTGSIQQVTFSMFCSQFDVVQLNNSGYAPPSWFSASQSSSNPWIFKSTVNLSQDVVDKSAYSQMPPAIQAAIHNISSTAFTVQQLYFDLTTSALYSTPTIEGVAPDSPLGMVLSKEFVSRYMSQARQGGQPLLGVNITEGDPDAATLKLTNFNLQINPYYENGVRVQEPTPLQKKAYTVDYLCMTGNHALPTATQFTWNWVDADRLSEQHGVVSINRNAFCAWFTPQLTPYFQGNCIQPTVRVDLDGASQPVYSYGKAGGNPTYASPTSGDVVYTVNWTSGDAFDQAGWHGAIGKFWMRSDYSASVRFTGSQVIIQQHLVIWTKVEKDSSSGEGNIIDRTVKDTYTVGVDAQGKITWTLAPPEISYNDYDPSVNAFLNFFLHINTFVADLKGWASNFASTSLGQPPLNGLADFIFPGGKAFAFRSAQFSAYQDFIAGITYLDPTPKSVVHMAAEREMKSLHF